MFGFQGPSQEAQFIYTKWEVVETRLAKEGRKEGGGAGGGRWLVVKEYLSMPYAKKKERGLSESVRSRAQCSEP
jgi:hypothetical protein